MRIVRCSFVAAFTGSLALATQLIACGGDEPKGGGNATSSSGAPSNSSSSSSGEPSSSSGAPAGPTLTISDSRSKVYLGQRASIDGAAIAPELGITGWTVVFAPTSSAITTASLEAASTANPSFTPDVLGSYTLRADGAAGSVLVFVEAIDAPIFWRSVDLVTTNAVSTISISTLVGGAHTVGAAPISCPPPTSASSAELLVAGQRGGMTGADVWEGSANQPARLAYPDLVQDAANPALLHATLNVATSASRCGASEAKVLQQNDTSLDEGAKTIRGVRFSPSGTRLAYLQEKGEFTRVLSTIGFDGSAQRDLSLAASDAAGGLTDAGAPLVQYFGPVLPRWLDETHVGFLSFRGDDGNPARSAWDLYTVEDAPGALPVLVMSCATNATSLDFLPNGQVLVAARSAAGASPMNLFVYSADPTTKQCVVVRNLTNFVASDQIARDVALSPDKTKVVFFAGQGDGMFFRAAQNQLSLFWVPTDGSAVAALVPGAPIGAAEIGRGPRWLAGGAALTWGEAGGFEGELTVGRILALNPGGETRIIAAGESSQFESDAGTRSTLRFVAGAGQGCSASPGTTPTSVAALGSALGLLALVARRGKKRSA